MRELNSAAQAAVGCVVLLMGNHELMNIAGDFRYAHPQATAAFGGMDSRKEAFSPTGEVGSFLREQGRVSVVVEQPNGSRTLFSHAGIKLRIISSIGSIEALNRNVREGIKGAARDLLGFVYHTDVAGDEGPLWTRTFGLRGSTSET